MRVLLLTWEYPPKSVGGLARHVEDLATALAEQDQEVHVLTCHAPEAPANEQVQGVHVHRVSPYTLHAPDFTTWVMQLNFALLERAVALKEEEGPFDIVHAHDWLVAFAGRALKHAYQVPLVATIHATEAGRNHGLHNDLQRYIGSTEWWLTYEGWRVIVCSEHMRREVQHLFQLPADKIAVIPNGVFQAKFSTGRPDLSFTARFAQPWEKVVFFVGRLVREKGVHILLEAAPAVLAKCPEAKFVVAGTGPMEGALKQQAWSMGLWDKVCFTGYIDDQTRNNLYSMAKVAVFPSLYEPFGIVALEGMAAGTPVVVADTGGLGEIIHHGVNGLKAYVGNPQSLADNILAVLHDPGLAERLRRNASGEVARVYDWRQIARKTAQVYTAVLREYRASPWQLDRNPVYRMRRYAMALVGGQRKSPGTEQAAASRNGYTLIERRVGAVNFRKEGGTGY